MSRSILVAPGELRRIANVQMRVSARVSRPGCMRTTPFLASCFLLLTLVWGAREHVFGQAVDPTHALATLQDKVLSKGPHGEEPTPAGSVKLSAEEVEKIRALKAKAAIVGVLAIMRMEAIMRCVGSLMSVES